MIKKATIWLIIQDTLMFFISLAITYFIFSAFRVSAISFLILKAYWSGILFLWLLFLAISNLFGLYNLHHPLYSAIRILLACCLYGIALIGISYMFPKYELSRILFFIQFLCIYFLLNGSRLLLFRIKSNIQ